VILKHIMPNILGPIVVTAALDVGAMIMNLAGLSYLGLGVVPPTPEWGSMMSEGRSMLQTSPWIVLAPGLAIFITVIIFNLLGDTVRDILDPKQTRRTLNDNVQKMKGIFSGRKKREKTTI
ncbi:MAG: ABC transporter permease, partial [Acutalibacteraceae bacterium]